MDNQGSALWLTFIFAGLMWCGLSFIVAAVLGMVLHVTTPKPKPTNWRRSLQSHIYNK